MRRLHSFALNMGWLPWPILAYAQWPRLKYQTRRAITANEAQRLLDVEKNSEWRAFLQLLWHVGAAQVDMAGLTHENIDWQNPKVISIFKWVQALSSVLLFMLPAFLYARFTFTGNYSYFLGFKKAENANMYILAIVGILLAMPFVFWLGKLNESIPLPESLTKLEQQTSLQMAAFLKIRNTFDIAVNVFIIALLPAIGEELCFRGALQRILIQLTRNPWAGIIITAILFSSLHLQFMGFLPRMFLGIVLGAFYWYSGSIWTSMIAHFVNNAVQVIAASYAPKYIDKNPETPVLAAIVSGIVVWAILWYFQKQSTVTYSKVYNTDELTPTNQFLA
jgi:membrane protease YdiL (CAAX protease family)